MIYTAVCRGFPPLRHKKVICLPESHSSSPPSHHKNFQRVTQFPPFPVSTAVFPFLHHRNCACERHFPPTPQLSLFAPQELPFCTAGFPLCTIKNSACLFQLSPQECRQIPSAWRCSGDFILSESILFAPTGVEEQGILKGHLVAQRGKIAVNVGDWCKGENCGRLWHKGGNCGTRADVLWRKGGKLLLWCKRGKLQ